MKRAMKRAMNTAMKRINKPLGVTGILVGAMALVMTTGVQAQSASGSAKAAAGKSVTVEVHAVSTSGVGEALGEVKFEHRPQGILITPDLEGLEPGLHGFHIHEKPSCDPADKDGKTVAAQAAGGHLDPQGKGQHKGPYASGHLGDLPALYVDDEGRASLPLFAPNLKMKDLQGHALMVHSGGDNYADEPEKLGGGGERVACGVIK